MSGTPVTNTPDKLWAILHWLYPKDFSSYWRHIHHYIEVEITPQGYRKLLGPKNEAQLLSIIDPFFIRRLKKEVWKDLPDKYYSEIVVTLTHEQRKAYVDMKDTMISWLGDALDIPLVTPVVFSPRR